MDESTGKAEIISKLPKPCQLEFTSLNTSTTTIEIPFKKCSVTRLFYEYPLRIFVPKHASNTVCQWVYNFVYGGGLVSGDRVVVQVRVKDFACVLWTSQSFQKVYISESSGSCYQDLSFQLGPSSFLAVVSDPVLCYRDADFRQTQEVRMTSSSNLVLLDWYTAGRIARGEWWSFKCLFSSIHIYIDDKMVVRENLELSSTPEIDIKDTVGDFGVFGTCIIVGPFLKSLFDNLILTLNSRSDGGKKCNRDLIITASPLFSRQPISKTESIGCILRLGAINTTLAYQELAQILSPLTPIFGDNPFENKY